jgi:hypothetical protein
MDAVLMKLVAALGRAAAQLGDELTQAAIAIEGVSRDKARNSTKRKSNNESGRYMHAAHH